MKLLHGASFALILAALAPATRADATLRFHTEFQTSALIPPGTLDQALGSVRDMTLQIRGNKGRSMVGGLISIADLKTQDLTMLDVVNKHFSTVPASQYAEHVKIGMPAVPEDARAMIASLKTNMESHST